MADASQPLAVSTARYEHVFPTLTPAQMARYHGRASGPLRDRMDLIVDVPAVPAGGLPGPGPAGFAAAVGTSGADPTAPNWPR